jgi:hypothetical protein
METPNEILTELQEIAPVLGQKISVLPYRMPEGFLAGFSDILMNRIRVEEALGISPGTTGFTINHLEAGVEIEEISPLLAGLKNKTPYQVPTGFFEGWNAKIPDLIPTTTGEPIVNIEETKPHVVVMPEKRVSVFSGSVLRYAVAACVIALLGTTIYQFAIRHDNINTQNDPLGGLSAVSDQDMANYLDSDDIHWTPGISSSTVAAEFNENDVHDLLSNVSDSELEQYLPSLPKGKGTVN